MDTLIEDIQATQNCTTGDDTQSEQTTEKVRRVALAFTEEQEMPIVDFLCDNELIYNRK